MKADNLKDLKIKLDDMKSKIMAKKKPSENDYLKLNLISLSKTQLDTAVSQDRVNNSILEHIREISRIVILLFLLAWFRNEIIWLFNKVFELISNYIKFATEGFPKLSFDTQYQLLVVTIPLGILSFFIGRFTKK